ncbi:hypothetical protein CL614_01575 [archaeon]|nr:hypothetical protein [archaeon]
MISVLGKSKKSKSEAYLDKKEIPLRFKYNVKHLEIIPKRLVSSMFMGNYKSIFRGRGLEFEDFRQYVLGDDARLIDWRASLKTGELLIKEFIEERNLNVFFILDVSSKMCAGSIDKFKNEYAAEFVAAVSYAVMGVGDSVGLGMFSEDVINFVPPNTGPSQFYSIRKELINSENYGGGYDLKKALKYFGEIVERGAMLLVISDFIGIVNQEGSEELETLLKTLSKKYDVIGVMVRDVRDRELPRGVGNVLVSDPETGKEVVINPDEMGSEYENYVRAEEDSIRKMFIRSNASMLMLDTNKSFMYPMLRFFKRRSEQFR